MLLGQGVGCSFIGDDIQFTKHVVSPSAKGRDPSGAYSLIRGGYIQQFHDQLGMRAPRIKGNTTMKPAEAFLSTAALFKELFSFLVPCDILVCSSLCQWLFVTTVHCFCVCVCVCR